MAALTSPAGNAVATGASILGLLLALAPLLGSTVVLSAIGVTVLVWAAYQLLAKSRARAYRFVGGTASCVAILVVAVLTVREVVRPETIEFFYGGDLLTSPDSSPLAGEVFPVLTVARQLDGTILGGLRQLDGTAAAPGRWDRLWGSTRVGAGDGQLTAVASVGPKGGACGIPGGPRVRSP